jgi:spermidine synthase
MTAKPWISETLFDPLGLRMSFEVERVLYETRTDHQHLVLFEHRLFGKMLMLDGATQVTTRDEFIYHEMMTHVPILAHGETREVLVVGGGDCGIAKEALKHASVKRLTQVEIDASVVEFSKEHFAEFTDPVLSDPRFDLIIDDGMKYVARADRRFDVIIVDSTDPHGPGAVLFTYDFYAACKRCLSARGVMGRTIPHQVLDTGGASGGLCIAAIRRRAAGGPRHLSNGQGDRQFRFRARGRGSRLQLRLKKLWQAAMSECHQREADKQGSDADH